MSMFKFVKSWFEGGNSTTYVGNAGDLTINADGSGFSIHDGVTPGGNPVGADLPVLVITYSDQSESANDSIGGIPGSGISWPTPGGADVLFTTTSATTVTASGVIAFYNSGPIPLLASGGADIGADGARFNAGGDMEDFIAYAWATNAAGTSYSAPASGSSRPLCLAAGTSIALSNGLYKNIEDITYDDMLLVWNFDNGCYAESKPLWIKSSKTARDFNVLGFNDGSYLHTIGQHRIFNKEAGAFTYPMTDHTPLGTTTVNQFGREITLTEKSMMQGEVDYYNIITDYHMNLFANGILTSTSFNNLYPIVDMRFVKEVRESRILHGIPDQFHHGMRLSEQLIDEASIRRYVERLIATDVLISA